MSEQTAVIEAAVERVTATMDGGAVQRVGMDPDDASFWNKPVLYHLWKALHHLLRAWHVQDVNAKETEGEVRLYHLDCAATRIDMIKAILKRDRLVAAGLTVDTTEQEKAGE